MEISQERLEKFWKRWGFWQIESESNWWFADWYADKDLPALTLDSLFKYAVPAASIQHLAFHFYRNSFCVNLYNENDDCVVVEADTPALALFLALEKLT